ncbi:MAG: prepilin-type N-terminal cleavage/methylation domain-containing protein [Marinicella sp.]|nr:prepilin-type N-terminal cleavage/methylation domain-containing protein [Xanthomonadales bacterium]
MKKHLGFTLIEVIVVLVMLATLAGIVAFNMSGSLKASKIRGASKELVAALRYTRSQAVIKHEEQRLMLNVTEKSYQAPGRPKVILPEGMELKVFAAESEIPAEDQAGFRFFSDGSSTGGRVTLIYEDRFWRINVAWLTGEVRLFKDTEV